MYRNEKFYNRKVDGVKFVSCNFYGDCEVKEVENIQCIEKCTFYNKQSIPQKNRNIPDLGNQFYANGINEKTQNSQPSIQINKNISGHAPTFFVPGYKHSSNSIQSTNTLNIGKINGSLNVGAKTKFQCIISKNDFLSKEETLSALVRIEKIEIIENEKETVTLIFTGDVYNEYLVLRSFIEDKKYSLIVAKNLIDAELIENLGKFVEVMCLARNSSDNTILDKKYKFSISFLDRCNCEEKNTSNEIIERLIANNKIEKSGSEFIVFSIKTLKQTAELENLINNFFSSPSTNIDSSYDEIPPSYDEVISDNYSVGANNNIVNHASASGTLSDNIVLINGRIINNGKFINTTAVKDKPYQQKVTSSATTVKLKSKSINKPENSYDFSKFSIINLGTVNGQIINNGQPINITVVDSKSSKSPIQKFNF